MLEKKRRNTSPAQLANLQRGGGRGFGSEPKYDHKEIIRLRKEEKLTPLEIADTVGCSERTAFRVLRDAGMGYVPPSFTEEEQRLILALLEDGCPYTEVARSVGSTTNIIEHRWPGYGIQDQTEALLYARARRDFERLVRRLGLDERKER